jgi:diacylglycerol kinase
VSGHHHSHAVGATRLHPSQPRPAAKRTPPTARHAPRATSYPDVASTAAPDTDAAPSRQLWWQMATFHSQTAVTRATFFRSFVFAWNGLRHAIVTQRNARVHALLAAIAIALGIWLRISPVEFAIVFVAITGVFISEMFNTVAEACVDLITDQYHPLAKVAKDVAAGAVLLNAMLSVVVGLFVYVPHLWPLVRHWLVR